MIIKEVFDSKKSAVPREVAGELCTPSVSMDTTAYNGDKAALVL